MDTSAAGSTAVEADQDEAAGAAAATAAGPRELDKSLFMDGMRVRVTSNMLYVQPSTWSANTGEAAATLHSE